MKLAIVGTGYVGLVSGACFSDMGNDVICVDVDEKKVKRLQEGKIPIYEPGLDEIVQRNVEAKRLKFTTRIEEALEVSDICFIAVGTLRSWCGNGYRPIYESSYVCHRQIHCAGWHS